MADEIEKFGHCVVSDDESRIKVHIMTIIGEIEGHEVLPASSKSTKYEHLLPEFARLQQESLSGGGREGILLLINTVGGDVSAGLALAEMVASLSVPTVALVLGDAHSIGVPLMVSADYSIIAPTATVIVHPVRMNGTIIGAPQTYEYFKLIQDRIVNFISSHANISRERLEEMMINKGVLTKDLGTILIGEEAVREGMCQEVGGIHRALEVLRELIDKR